MGIQTCITVVPAVFIVVRVFKFLSYYWVYVMLLTPFSGWNNEKNRRKTF